jgi:hypothetical protein
MEVRERYMDVRERYHEVYLNGKVQHEGRLKDCQELARQYLVCDCVEIYEVVVKERKVTL